MKESKKDGEIFINKIAKEYDVATARVGRLMQYDSEAKAVHEDKVDKVKENTRFNVCCTSIK